MFEIHVGESLLMLTVHIYTFLYVCIYLYTYILVYSASEKNGSMSFSALIF